VTKISGFRLRASDFGLQAVTAVALAVWRLALFAQQPAPGPSFEVVSIKRSDPGATSGGIRIRPDGQLTMTNQGLSSIIRTAYPSAVEIVGLPDWMNTERYDLVATPPANTSRDKLPLMWKALWTERMRLRAHLETRERPAYALILARSDGRLGPNLRPATVDCAALAAAAKAPEQQGGRLEVPSISSAGQRCGLSLGPGTMETGSATIAELALTLRGLSGRPVIVDKTGLTGRYAIALTYSNRPAASPDRPESPVDDRPSIFTALQEQLGLKLEPTQSSVEVLIVDHVERPTEN
jgi:uncharacterized protein (TIGR03435 family)